MPSAAAAAEAVRLKRRAQHIRHNMSGPSSLLANQPVSQSVSQVDRQTDRQAAGNQPQLQLLCLRCLSNVATLHGAGAGCQIACVLYGLCASFSVCVCCVCVRCVCFILFTDIGVLKKTSCLVSARSGGFAVVLLTWRGKY